MLKKIKLDNYTTFINPTSIDFTATNYKFLENENVGDNKILKGCLFVGENASGKTQILKSITFLLDLLFSNNEIAFFVNKSFYTNKKSYKLEYTFIEDKKEIDYFIEVGYDKVISERLIFDNNIIIDRLGNTAKFYLNDEKIFNDISDKLLFLRRIYFDTNFYDNKTLNKWFNYMKNSIYVNCNDRIVKTYSNQDLLIHNYLDKNGVDKINDFFKKINYNQKIEYQYITPNSSNDFMVKSNSNKKFVSFMKEGTSIYIPEMFESTGNNTFMHLLPPFFSAINNECMLILDEFSSGFHNELEECLIKYFFHYAKNSQIFFVSHSTNLLNNTILRPDQIYATYFDSKKGTMLKRFSDEMPRESQNTEKMYLNGVFNGLPRYNKFFKD